METRPVIFVSSVLLLVPFMYGLTLLPEACAEPKDPNWGKTGTCKASDDTKRMSCCWREPDITNPGENLIWCQTCDNTPEGGNCGPVTLSEPTESMGVPPGDGVLQEPSNVPSNDSGPKLFEKGGGILQFKPTENNTGQDSGGFLDKPTLGER